MNNEDRIKIKQILGLVEDELQRATEKFGKFNSLHEGWAIMYEEFDELWDEVKKREVDLEEIRDEAVQVAAMAIRLIVDCTNFEVSRSTTCPLCGGQTEHDRELPPNPYVCDDCYVIINAYNDRI